MLLILGGMFLTSVSTLMQRPKEVVRRISDEVFDDDGDLTHLSRGNGETSNDGVKVLYGVASFSKNMHILILSKYFLNAYK